MRFKRNLEMVFVLSDARQRKLVGASLKEFTCYMQVGYKSLFW